MQQVIRKAAPAFARVAASDADVADEKRQAYIVSWPGKWPKGGAEEAEHARFRILL